MKKLFLIICMGLLLTACVKDTYVVLSKECIEHTFSSDNYYLILQRSDGKKISYLASEREYLLYTPGDTLELYR